MVREMKANAYYQVEISEPDGTNGYYRNMPEICAQLEIGIVKYQIRSEIGLKIKGELRLGSQVISDNIRGDGRYTLNMWAEDGKGNILEESSFSQEFIVDSQTEQDAIRFVWNQDTRRMEIIGRDLLSGVRSLSYKIGNGDEIHTKDQMLYLKVSGDFAGDITATLVDGAGNHCVEKYKVEREEKPSQSTASHATASHATVSQSLVPHPSTPQSNSVEDKLTQQNSAQDIIQNQDKMSDATNEEAEQKHIADTTSPRIVNIVGLENKITQFTNGNYAKADMECFDIEAYIEEESLYFCEYAEKDDGIELRITDDFGNQTIEQIPIKANKDYSIWSLCIPIFLLLIAIFAWKLCRRGLY